MALTTNQQLNKITESKIREFDELFRSIDDCILMTIGEPDFGMPSNVKQAAIQAIESDASHYAHSMGTIGVRKAVASFLEKKYNLSYDPEKEIVMTTGATEAIYSTLVGILNPGEKVIIPTPSFPLYKQATTVAYGEVVELNTVETGFLVTPDQIHEVMKEHGDAKAIILNYPSNPTGVTYTRAQLEGLAQALAQYDIFVISDEIYSELTYCEKHTSIASLLPEQTLLISGASKSYAMTGWRVGFVAARAGWIPSIFKAHQTATTTGVTVSFDAAEEAYKNSDDAVEEMRAQYEVRKNICVDALRSVGFTVPEPNGAFYVFAKIPEAYGTDDLAFCRTIATEAKVGMIPGRFFGAGGEGYVRMSFAIATDTVQEAMDRITAYLR